MVRKALITAVVVASLASQVQAQSTGTPAFQAPYRSFNRLEFGGTVSDPGPGFALEGFYRFGHKRYDVGFRAGFADPGPGNGTFLAGVDFRTRVIDHSSDFPLDGAFTAGVGGSFGNGDSRGYIPIGLSLGRRVQLEDSNLEFVPYIHPVLTPSFGDGPSDLLFGLGLGVDVTINKRFDVRVSGGVGDYHGIAISFAVLH